MKSILDGRRLFGLTEYWTFPAAAHIMNCWKSLYVLRPDFPPSSFFIVVCPPTLNHNIEFLVKNIIENCEVPFLVSNRTLSVRSSCYGFWTEKLKLKYFIY